MGAEPQAGPLEVGQKAPDFTLKGVHEGEIETYTLSEYTDQGAVLLGVYAWDFSPVCADQLCQLSDMDWYQYKTDLSIFGLAVEGPWSHMAFAEQEGIGFPLLCDTGGETLREYGVLYEEHDGLRNVPKRSVFLIDADRRVQYRWIAEDNWDEFGINPIEEAISSL